MRPIYFAAAFALALGSAACVGILDPMPGDDTPDPDPDPMSASRQMFERDVSPMLLSACAGCHVGPIDGIPLKFLGNSGVSGFYTAVTADVSITGGFNPGLSNLLRKGQHDGGNARAWTDPEKEIITAWLLSEATERGIEIDDSGIPPGGPAAPTTSREALARWSACMTLEDWNQSQVYQWANKGSDRGQCVSCHNQGAGGFYASANRQEMFEMNRYEIYIMTFFTARPKDITNPSLGYEVVVNEQKLRAKAQAVGHPSYNADGGNQMTYLRNFYNLTKARWDAGTCPEGGFPTTPPTP